jgi:hypothetical protein
MKSKLRAFLRNLPLAGAAGLINLPTGDLGTTAPNGILPALANRAADILTFLAYPIAFIGIIYSVYMLVANSGNPDALKTTKKNIGYIAGGIFLLIFTIFIFNFVVTIFNP